METTEIKYSIKKSLLNNLLDYILFIFGFYLLSLIDFKELKNLSLNSYFIPAISIIFIVAYGKNVIFELLNLKSKIIFSKKYLEINNRVLDWSDITKQKIISKKEFTPKYKIEYEEHYLSLFYKKEKIELKIDNYNSNPEEFRLLLNKFSAGKNVINLTDKKFSSIIGYKEYCESNASDSEKEISKTLALFENDVSELKKFCKDNVFNETDKVNFIYHCLSENQKKSDRFLTNEFLRVYKLSLLGNNFKKLFPLLENIIVDDINTPEAEKIRIELFSQIDSKNLLTRLKTIQLIYHLVDKDILTKNADLASKIKVKMNDENWKVRWNAKNLLRENKIDVKELRILDKIKAKYLNQYEV